MSFAKDEILNIKKSKKDFRVENFENQEYIAPSKYSLTTKNLKIQSTKNYKSNIESIEEKVHNEKNNKEETKKEEEKNEVNSSDISDDEE